MPTLQAFSGNLLEATQSTTQQYFNNGYRHMQDELADGGVDRFYGDILIPGIPAVTNMDPAVLCFISWTQVFDGTNYQTTPVLPSDLILPLWMSERVNGSMSPLPCWPDLPNMKMWTDGLPWLPKQPRNLNWEWRDEAIYYPGSTSVMDFRIRYRKYLPDIVDIAGVPWWTQSVPVVRCQDALSWWVAAEYAAAQAARHDLPSDMLMALAQLAAACQAQAKHATDLMINRDVQKNERTEVRRIPYGGGSRGQGYNGGGGGWW